MSSDSNRGGQGGASNETRAATVDLELRPEQRLIRTGGCFRYVDFHLLVSAAARQSAEAASRPPLALALVLDRSGSMQGEKLRTAKHAALSVVDRLDERDLVALVIFDNQIETIQPAAAATGELKARVRSLLSEVEARAMTALHEGWLSGCDAIVRDDTQTAKRLARCFLLTDGLANVGLTDPEAIAGQAAGIREKAGISTSTFGIGEDYSEELLGPMAQAGGGAFHHLRRPAEIATTFVAELGQLFSVAATQARLEIEAEAGMTVDVVSGFWARPESGPDTQKAGEGASRWSVALGDLVAGDEHHVVARVHFPAQDRREEQGLRARVIWRENGVEHVTGWRELRFAYAADAACDAEPRDSAVALYAGRHLSDRSMRDAIRLSKSGDLHGARRLLEETARDVGALGQATPELDEELQRLRGTSMGLAHAPMPSAISKEMYYQSQRRSTGRRDRRGQDSPPDGGPTGDSDGNGDR